jgi:hypothetical protein
MPKVSAKLAGHVLDQHAEPAAADPPLFLELLDHVHGDIDGDREGQPHEAAGAAVDLGIDADHLAVEVEQRPAGVAGIDGDVGLDEGHIVLGGQVAALGADDAGRGRVLEAERRADGEHPFAHLEVRRRADLHRRQVIPSTFKQRDVAALVGADDPWRRTRADRWCAR